MRNYKKDPLKHGENIPFEEFYDLYINQGYSRSELQEYFNVGRTKIFQTLKKYNIQKTEEQKRQTQKDSSLRKYGTTHPRLDKECNEKAKQKTKKTCLEKYGVESVGQCPEIRERAKQTCIKKYGTVGVIALPEIREKIKQTNLERYGNENVCQTEQWKEKHKKTNLKKYGVEFYFQTEEFKEKSKRTCMEKYGVEIASQSKEIKEKTKNNNLEKYGVEYPNQLESFKQIYKNTCLEKYGVDNVSKLDEIKEKSKRTCQEKYGYDYASQSPEFRAKVAKTNLERFGAICNLTTKEGIEKKTKTWLKNLGVDHPSKNSDVVNRQWESRKRNGTCSTSKSEEYIYNKLTEKFGHIKRNYKCNRYPFHVDFYIPIIDTFIEYQGFEGHGEHPFDYQNKEDVEKLLYWAKKADEKKIDKRNKYLAYISIWIERDPIKRKIAKTNELNWFEFFNLEQFNEWFEKQ